MEIVIAPVLKIVKLAWGSIGSRIGYIKNLKKHIEELNKNAEHLYAIRDDLKEKINCSITRVATKECIWWLENVKLIEDQVNSIQEECKETKKCLPRWCPNVFSSMKLGKCAYDIIKEIIDLKNKRLTFEGKELSDKPLEKVQPQDVEINSSIAMENTLQKILGLIEDVKIQKIGIWGMGGVGKTRTLKLLNDRPKVFETFEIVIWVTVSNKRNQRSMQNEIARRLQLEVFNESDDQLQATICQALRRKKFLLLLDDLWEKIDLSDIGIPSLNQDNGCKVVLTTRSLGVCRQMETDEEVRVDTLSKDEAWCLFSKKVGDVALSPHIEPIARRIVEECDGLPLAIIVVGSSLRKNSDVVVWRNTLRELQLPTTSQIEAMEERVFRCMRSSYDRLQDDFKKKLFLYCSFYPKDYEIKITELAEYCWLEGYIHGVGSIEEARDKGHSMVMTTLVDASLLERGHDEGYVKMHDIVRDFALREATGSLVKAGRNFKHPPEEKEWLQLQKISLMRSSLRSLLERPNCNILSTLLLQYNNQLLMIPDSFFEYMHSLNILDLSGTKVKSLPSSLWNLVNLRGLYLKDCVELEDLPSQVRALKRLEVLHLGGRTGIKYLPREVGELTGLKRLTVGFKYRDCSENEDDTKEWRMKLRVPTGIIPNLPLLEELSLYVLVCCNETPAYIYVGDCIDKGQWDDESMEAVVDELCRLERLTYLDAYFPKVECLEHFLSERKSLKESWFRSFRFRVGNTRRKDRWDFPREHDVWERCLVYKGGHGMAHAGIMETLGYCSLFHLQDHLTAKKLSELDMAKMNELKECRVISCDKMETLFNGDEEQEICALPNLERLEIWNLPNWRSLWVGPLFPGSLSKLTFIRLGGCNNLKKVFQLGVIRQLCSLKFLHIDSCSTVEEMVAIEEMSVTSHTHIGNNDRVVLPNIKFIGLRDLPELVSIFRGFSNLELPSLNVILTWKCPKLKSLSFLTHRTNCVAPTLKEIKGPNSWWEALEWEDNDIKQSFQPFFFEWQPPHSIAG